MEVALTQTIDSLLNHSKLLSCHAIKFVTIQLMLRPIAFQYANREAIFPTTRNFYIGCLKALEIIMAYCDCGLPVSEQIHFVWIFRMLRLVVCVLWEGFYEPNDLL